jgi:hypothetical protein
MMGMKRGRELPVCRVKRAMVQKYSEASPSKKGCVRVSSKLRGGGARPAVTVSSLRTSRSRYMWKGVAIVYIRAGRENLSLIYE